MHTILFQLTIIPLTMCRLLISKLWLSPIGNYFPFNEMTKFHIALGYTFIFLLFATIVVFLMFFGVLCNSGAQAFCDKFKTEIIITGYVIFVVSLFFLHESSKIVSLHHNAWWQRKSERSMTNDILSIALVLISHVITTFVVWYNRLSCPLELPRSCASRSHTECSMLFTISSSLATFSPSCIPSMLWRESKGGGANPSDGSQRPCCYMYVIGPQCISLTDILLF